jgi:acyl-CoA synthetase (AMP-forming)/AMP-acid ligase II
LRALINIGLELAPERDSDRLLHKACVAARDLFGATYVTLGILDRNDRTVQRFLTCGADATCGVGAANWIKTGDTVSGDHAVRHQADLGTFRRIYTGGAPVFPGMLDAIAAVAPNASVVAVYGSTEAEPIAKIDRRDIIADDRAAMTRGAGLLSGRPTSSIQLRILPDRWGTPVGPWTVADLERDTLGPDEVGEIVVAGEHVLSGYLDGHGDEETKIRVGEHVWHRTGDAGYLDGQGRLWLLGRCSAKANDSDGVLYPLAVECAAGAVPGVGRTAFVMHRQRRLLAAEVEGDVAAVRAELMERLAWAKLANVVIVPRIPVDRRHNAKVDYPALLKVLDRARSQDIT